MSRKLKLFLFLLLLANQNHVLAQHDDLFFQGFDRVRNNMSLNGAAKIKKNGLLSLTNDSHSILGHAFYSRPIKFKNSSNGKAFSFSSAFVFAVVPKYPNLGGHGLAFTLSTSSELPGAFPRQYLGLLNKTVDGSFPGHIFAVEFDTHRDYDFFDINDNHVGVNINSMVSNKSVPAAYFLPDSEKKELNLTSGKPIQAWVDYDSVKNQLEVRLSPFSTKPIYPILSIDIDLSNILNDSMYVGFSSSTGLLTSTHYVLGWSFSVNGEAKSFSISSLPSLPGTKNLLVVVVCVSVASTFVIILGIATSLYLFRKIKDGDMIEGWELQVGPNRFSYQELRKATGGFREKELLGFGGFGKVYKGTLPNSDTPIAVKRFCHESRQGLREFSTEITSIGRLRHKNLVRLLGWSRRGGELLLVYDYMPNGSLDKYIFEKTKAILKWEQRFKIVKDVASGLLYLHEEWEQTVIHRDIKAGNVLLDSELNGRLGDFGLAKLYERGSNPITTKFVEGDQLSLKHCLKSSSLVDWVWDKWKSGAILDVVDPRLKGEFDKIEAVLLLKLGLMCSNYVPKARPLMRKIVRYLEGEVELPELIAAPDVYDGENADAKTDSGDELKGSYVFLSTIIIIGEGQPAHNLLVEITRYLLALSWDLTPPFSDGNESR
ncbi:hypothetical protein OIU77_012559 [Salix suchowensis]|uniref:Protein kinase domain-containing protein n=1 Tax=Salix suchowensis TaxID=1278906 RepID=A0ABQ9A4N3_9ROSI|nr:hypothetical protein OIU77_012559 [Salix suchowensis]